MELCVCVYVCTCKYACTVDPFLYLRHMETKWKGVSRFLVRPGGCGCGKINDVY